MRKIALLLCFVISSLTLFAQMPGGMQVRGAGQQAAGRFYGKVVDAANKGIEAASVTLVSERMDSTTRQKKEVIIGGMLSAASGDFSIDNIPVMGRYTLKITGIGYKSYEQSVGFQMPGRNGAGNNPSAMLAALDKDLGNIKLEIDDKVLSGVTVTANKPLLQMGIDRKVFNVDRNIVSQGGTAVDVMKNVPSVNVDIDGNVTLRNNAPQVFVDGRPTNLTLDQIPADNIESVEIITNPSAKFDASGGTAGILNIVLKKNKRVGYSGNLRTNVDSRGRLGFGGDINVRQNKVNFFAGGMLNQRKSVSTGTTERTTFGTVQEHFLQLDNSTGQGMFGFGRAGIDYFIDNRNTLTVSGTIGKGKMEPSSVGDIYIDSFTTPVRSYFNQRFSNSTANFRNLGTQLSFKHNFPKAGREWTADVTYNRGKNNNTNLVQTDSFRMPGKTPIGEFDNQQFTEGVNENIVVQSDYTNPINEKSKVDMGVRALFRNINSATAYYNTTGGGKVPLTSLNKIYNSTDYIYAAYATYSNQLKKFGYQVGLRAESSNYQGTLNNDKAQSFDIDFPISLFPSVFLTHKINEQDELQLNYSRRINRPNFFQLFPFTDYSDPLNITRGNPELKPEFTNSLELSYSKIFKNRDNFITSLYFKNTNNLITRFLESEYDTTFKKDLLINTYINANSSYITGLELTGKNKITKWWDITSNLNLFTSMIDLETAPDPDQLFSYFAKLNNNFKLPKNFSFQLSADYQSKTVSAAGGGGGGRGHGGGMFGGPSSSAQGYIRANYGVDAAVRFEFLKNKAASVSLNMNDIFRTRKYDVHSESPMFVQDAVRRRDPQILRLNFNYRFGKFDASLFKRKNTRAENGDMNMDGTGM